MSSKFLESLKKTICKNIPGNKNLPKVHDKKDNKTVSVNVIRVSIISLEHDSVVCDGVCFYWSFRFLLKIAMKELVVKSVFSFGLWRSLFLVKLYVEEPVKKPVVEPVFSFRLWWSLFLAEL